MNYNTIFSFHMPTKVVHGFNAITQAGKEAKRLGIKKVFALTLATTFFKRLGFKVIDKEKLPMKVWTDCARCTKQDNCDEIAVVKTLT